MSLAIFLDRDGTLLVDEGYLADPAGIVFYAEAREAIALLEREGALLIVVTNQSGIARGFFTEATLADIHQELQRQLLGALDAIYHCPHHPTAGSAPRPCACRKPEPGLLERGMLDWGLQPGDCYMIGDSDADMLAGRRAGCTTVQFLNGTNALSVQSPPDYATESLLDAARWILRHARDKASQLASERQDSTR